MIEAKELMIGNYVSCPDFKIKFGIVGIMPYSYKNHYDEGVAVKVDNEYINTYILEPIPLTEAWLEKFGFRKEEEHIWLFPENDSFRLWGFAWDVEHFTFNDWTEISTPTIRHVHKLQNLYFSLTGKHLNI